MNIALTMGPCEALRGTHAEPNTKRQQVDRAARRMLQRRRETDGAERQPEIFESEREQIKKLLGDSR